MRNGLPKQAAPDRSCHPRFWGAPGVGHLGHRPLLWAGGVIVEGSRRRLGPPAQAADRRRDTALSSFSSVVGFLAFFGG